MTNSVFREVWLWHSRSKTRTKTGKIGLKFGKFAFFCGYITKLFTNFVKYKRSNKIWKSIKLWKSLFYNSVSAFWFILKKIYWAERSIAFFFFDFLGEVDFALLLFCDFSGKCSQECETIKSGKSSCEVFFSRLTVKDIWEKQKIIRIDRLHIDTMVHFQMLVSKRLFASVDSMKWARKQESQSFLIRIIFIRFQCSKKLKKKELLKNHAQTNMQVNLRVLPTKVFFDPNKDSLFSHHFSHIIIYHIHVSLYFRISQIMTLVTWRVRMTLLTWLWSLYFSRWITICFIEFTGLHHRK